MSWYDSGQNDQNVRYWLLDSSHGSYETRRAAIESLSPNYAIADGSVANTKVVTGYATDAEIAANSLDIGGAVLDRVHNYVNPNAAAVTIRTNAWGDKYAIWGEFLQQPDAISTAGIDALVQWWKDGLEDWLYVGQSATGDGSGSSHANLKAIKDILAIAGQTPTHDPTTYDGIVLCGTLSRSLNEGAQVGGITAGSAFQFKDGTSNARTQILAHPVDGCQIIAHARLGYGTGYGDPASWTDEGGGMFSLAMSSATIQVSTEGIAFSNAGGTLRPLTKVASSALCASTSDSWFPDPDYSGSNDRVYVHLADGSNPKTTTFIPTNGGGVTLGIPALTYFDVYGIEFWGNSFLGSNQTGAKNFAFYATKFRYYGAGDCFNCGAGTIDAGTGAFSYDQPTDWSFVGCEWEYGRAAIYFLNAGHNRVPLRTALKDCYLHHLNGVAADNYGVNAFSTADAHALATQGADDFLDENCRFDQCGAQTITHYILTNNMDFTNPGSPLDETAAYTDAWQYPAKCFAVDATTSRFCGRLRNTRTRYCLITNPRVAGDYATTAIPRAIAYQGDDDMLDLAGGQYDANVIEYNRVEGAISDGAISIKTCHGVEGERAVIRYNTIRGVGIGLHTLTSIAVFGGSTYNPSYTFGPGNDVHATTYFVQNEHIANEHIFNLDSNTYRNDDGADWKDGPNTRATLAAWQGAAQAGDTHDTNSTHTALTSDAGSPALTVSGGPTIGATLSAALGADPDGATSDLSFQWFRDGALIASAVNATYEVSIGAGNAADDDITCVVLGRDAEGKWFLVTSNTITLEAAAPPASPPPPPPPPAAASGGGGSSGDPSPWNKQPLPSLAHVRRLLRTRKQDLPHEIEQQADQIDALAQSIAENAPPPRPPESIFAPQAAESQATVALLQKHLAQVQMALTRAENEARRVALRHLEQSVRELRAAVRARAEAEEEEELVAMLASIL